MTIKNFRNFSELVVRLDKNVLLLGENRVGKSNFLYALRLVLDSGLPDSARALKLSDIWDGVELSTSPEVRVDVDIVDFKDDPAILSLLTQYVLPSDPNTAQLTYLFRKKTELTEAPKTEADFEFLLFGGDQETRTIRPDVRRRLSVELLQALRDAEGELANWRSSPLRPLIENATSEIAINDLIRISSDIGAASGQLTALEPISELEASIRHDLANLSGTAQDIKGRLGIAPSDPRRLFRSLGLYIDDGRRSIAEASAGSANLALIALRLAEFEWRREKNERNYTFICIEEPEAHLHPHLQRQVFSKLFAPSGGSSRSLFMTTHSPNIASVAPLSSIVLLKQTPTAGSKALSLANLELSDLDREDLQRYLDTNRADILFARGVILVEGDAESALLPVFAKSAGVDMDSAEIAVCNVSGINFAPYVKLLTALEIPTAVVTDWDPMEQQAPLGRKRALDLMDIFLRCRGQELSADERRQLGDDDAVLFSAAAALGVFLNSSTLEVEIAQTESLIDPLLNVLSAAAFGPTRQARIQQWRSGGTPIDHRQLMAMIADIGKGRLAGRLAAECQGLPPPTYIADAIHHVVRPWQTGVS